MEGSFGTSLHLIKAAAQQKEKNSVQFYSFTHINLAHFQHPSICRKIELELELIQSHMAQKPMLRDEAQK